MANSIHFGSSIGSSRPTTGSEARPQHVEEHNDERGNLDPDRLLQCPFDKNHKIRSCRFPYHLLKCRKNHPELASELKTCPFNARHLVPKNKLAHHTQTCEDRISVDNEKVEGTNDHHPQWHVPVSTWVNPDMQEDWDAEADDTASPFVWGKEKSHKLNPEVEVSNHLGPHVRAPKTLPWATSGSPM